MVNYTVDFCAHVHAGQITSVVCKLYGVCISSGTQVSTSRGARLTGDVSGDEGQHSTLTKAKQKATMPWLQNPIQGRS